jgi:hypothetical protein
MTREQVKNKALSRDCNCVAGKDRDSNFNDVINELFDYFEAIDKRSCETCASFENNYCTDYKAHNCIRHYSSFEDRWIARESKDTQLMNPELKNSSTNIVNIELDKEYLKKDFDFACENLFTHNNNNLEFLLREIEELREKFCEYGHEYTVEELLGYK